MSDTSTVFISTGTNSESFVFTETNVSTFSSGSTTTEVTNVITGTYSLDYYPNIIINPSNSLRFFNFIDLHWDLRETKTGPLDATRIHIFKNYDNTIPSDVYTEELGIPPYDDDWPDGTSLWFTKAIPGWRSGIMKYNWHDLIPMWQRLQHDPDNLASSVGSAVLVPIRNQAQRLTKGLHPDNYPVDTPSLFVPIRNCEGLRMEIYERNLVSDPVTMYGQTPKITIGNTVETRESYRAITPHNVTLIQTVNFDQAFSFDISNNWVQFVNTGTKHALWLEIIGAGVAYLRHYGTTSWIGNTPDTELFFNP